MLKIYTVVNICINSCTAKPWRDWILWAFWIFHFNFAQRKWKPVLGSLGFCFSLWHDVQLRSNFFESECVSQKSCVWRSGRSVQRSRPVFTLSPEFSGIMWPSVQKNEELPLLQVTRVKHSRTAGNCYRGYLWPPYSP